jgi:hypothetical protein
MQPEYSKLAAIFLLSVCLYVFYKKYIEESNEPTQPETFESNKYVNHERISDISGDLKSVPNAVRLNKNVLEAPQPSNNQYELSNNVSFDHQFNPKDQLTSADLLPKDETKWEASNPTNAHHLDDKNFCASGHHYGINTVGSSLRNPNLQIRSDPVIKQVDIGPWHQSTITADTNRRYFELGEA